MANKGYRVVAPDRYLTVREEPAEVVVRLGGEVFARSAAAVRLAEGDRPEVIYVPRADIDTARLVPSDKRFDCRWKGEAVYFHIDLLDRTLENAVWAYPAAPENLAALRERVAFDPERFAIEVGGERLR